MLLKLFWQTLVFGFLHVVVYVVWYISFVASVIFLSLLPFFRGLSKHSRLFGNPVSLLNGKLRQYSLVCHFSKAVSLSDGSSRQLLQIA